MKENKKIIVSAVQLKIKLGDPQGNLIRALKKIEKLAQEGVSLAVLPEMWICGYDFKNLEKIADQTPLVLDKLDNIARAYGITIIGSTVEQEGSDFFNTAFTMEGKKGVIGKYRKIHLFPLLREDYYFKRGNRSEVINSSIGKIGVILCFDIRFPELARSLALRGAEIVVVPAQWPKVRLNHWRTLLQARAIENQLFLIASACCGEGEKIKLAGHSMIIDPNGKILTEAGERETVIKAEIDLKEIEESRANMPCFSGRVPEAYS